MQPVVMYLGNNHFINVPDYVTPHQHATHELIYFVSGEGSIHCGKSLYMYIPGSVIIIPPGISHDEIHTTDSNVIFLLFTLDDDSAFHQPQCFNDMKDAIDSLMNSLRAEWSLKLPGHQEKLNATLTLLLVELMRVGSDHRLGNINDFSRQQSTISELNQPFFDDQNHSYMGYSPDHFRHLFKAKVGISPHQFTIQTRMEKARQLLDHTTLPITNIANSCDYTSASYFTMQFKKHTGMTPTEYRNRK